MNRPQNSSLSPSQPRLPGHIKRPSLLQVFEDVVKRVRCLSHLKMFVKGTKHNEKKGEGIKQYFFFKLCKKTPPISAGEWGAKDFSGDGLSL